jgi:hypothetical protein
VHFRDKIAIFVIKIVVKDFYGNRQTANNTECSKKPCSFTGDRSEEQKAGNP